MPLREGVFLRSWRDLKTLTTHWWRFRIPAAVLTAIFAAWGAALPPEAGVGERIALAVGGSLGGALLIGTLAFVVLVATAPIRQRNDAWEEVEQLTGADDPAVFVREFSTWVRAKRASLPDPPSLGFEMQTQLVFNREASAKYQAEHAALVERHNHTYREVERQARAEYHQRFRETAVALGGEAADAPHKIEEFESLADHLKERCQGI